MAEAHADIEAIKIQVAKEPVEQKTTFLSRAQKLKQGQMRCVGVACVGILFLVFVMIIGLRRKC